eukprot:75297-Chlamydomonas_euryale.AAC.8
MFASTCKKFKPCQIDTDTTFTLHGYATILCCKARIPALHCILPRCTTPLAIRKSSWISAQGPRGKFGRPKVFECKLTGKASWTRGLQDGRRPSNAVGLWC